MRHYLFWILAAGAAIPAFGAEKSNHYHDDTPLSAHHSIYSDIFIHKWLDAPRDGFKPIRAGLLKKSGNKIEITNPNNGNIDIVYAIISI